VIYSNEFHELCCSHLFCRIFNISPYKSISSEESEHTIAESSLRQSRWTYHLLCLEHRRESSMDTTRKALEDSRTIIITRPRTKPTRWIHSEGSRRHGNEAKDRRPPGGAGWPHMLGQPTCPACQMGPPPCDGLQPTSMTHLDHCFMLV